MSILAAINAAIQDPRRAFGEYVAKPLALYPYAYQDVLGRAARGLPYRGAPISAYGQRWHPADAAVMGLIGEDFTEEHYNDPTFGPVLRAQDAWLDTQPGRTMHGQWKPLPQADALLNDVAFKTGKAIRDRGGWTPQSPLMQGYFPNHPLTNMQAIFPQRWPNYAPPPPVLPGFMRYFDDQLHQDGYRLKYMDQLTGAYEIEPMVGW